MAALRSAGLAADDHRRRSPCHHPRSRGAARRGDRGQVPRCPWPLRPLRRSLRAGDADPRARSPRGRHPRAPAPRRFQAQLGAELKTWVGRPTALTFAPRLSAAWGAKVWLKREDLAHTGAHKINNALGQALLAQRLGTTAHRRRDRRRPARRRYRDGLRAPRPAVHGLHGRDRHGAPGAERRRACGCSGRGRAVTGGEPHARRRSNEAMRDWVADPWARSTCSARRSARIPIPMLVRDFQRVIGREARAQILEADGRLPDAVVACVGGGSNAIGMFHPFVGDRDVRSSASRRAAGHSDSASTRRPSPTAAPACCTAATRCCCRTPTARSRRPHSISAGLDYPGVGPEHALLMTAGRVQYESAIDDEALEALEGMRRARGHPAGARDGTRPVGVKRWARANPGKHGPLPLGPRRQGHADVAADGAEVSGGAGQARRDAAASSASAFGGPRRRPGDRRVPHRGLPDGAGFGHRAAVAAPPTWSRSACRSPTRWPTASPSSARARKR